MPNELYRVNEKGEVLVDDLPADLSAKSLASAEALERDGGVMKTALDYMRKIDWE